jgi:acyl-CoA thioester hydrolase
MLREHFTFSHTLRVRWAEVDRQDVVFNGNYFLYFDVAIAEYWRAIDLLDVRCRVARIGRTSMVFLFGIWRDDQHLTSGELVYVNADIATKRSAPWPRFLCDKILAFERTRPEVVGQLIA